MRDSRVLLLAVTATAACNSLAGISDLQNGDPQLAAPEAGPASSLGPGGPPAADAGAPPAPPTGTDGGSAATSDSGAGATADSGGAVVSDSGAVGVLDAGIPEDDAATPPTGCTGATVALVIHVIDSSSGQFTGIFSEGSIPPLNIGQSFQACVAPGTSIDLRAAPGDPSNAVHDWGVCGTGRRCDTTIAQPTTIDVHLL
jgi:hypothetical protein